MRRDVERLAGRRPRAFEDLFFSARSRRIEVPALRQRDGDVELLARTIWRNLGGEGELPAEIVGHLRHQTCPGNVRELHNLVARRIALARFRRVAALDAVETKSAS